VEGARSLLKKLWQGYSVLRMTLLNVR
jgi:hypothetical protein